MNNFAKAERLQELAKQLTYHQDQADQHKAAAAATEAEIRKHLGSPTKDVKVGNLTIDWSAPRAAFAADTFMKAYPQDKNPHMYKTVTTTSLDTAMIPPALKKNFMVPGSGDGTVKIK